MCLVKNWLFADGFAFMRRTSTARKHWQKAGEFQNIRYDLIVGDRTLCIAPRPIIDGSLTC